MLFRSQILQEEHVMIALTVTRDVKKEHGMFAQDLRHHERWQLINLADASHFKAALEASYLS